MEIIVGLPIAFLTIWYLIPKQTRVNFWLIIFDLFEDHFDAGGDRGTVTRSAPFTDEDIESALRKREAVLKRSELLRLHPGGKRYVKGCESCYNHTHKALNGILSKNVLAFSLFKWTLRKILKNGKEF
jgi:hypothetical protein